MFRFTRKRILIIFVVIISLILFEITGVIPYVSARISTTIYVELNYKNMDLRFEKVEFWPAYGNYSGVFSNNDGKIFNFMVTPKFMPFLIIYDPIKDY